MILDLSRRGYGYGSGLLGNNGQTFIVNIPKNASSYILNWSTHHGYKITIAENISANNQLQELVVVLRDPLRRWVSGIGQYLTSYVLNVTGAYSWDTGPGPNDQQISGDDFIAQYNQVVERLIFDIINQFDDHVWPQYDFFEKLLPDVPRKYFYLNREFDNAFAKHLNFNFIPGLSRNSKDSNPNTEKVQNFIEQRLLIRPELQARVKNAYARDYNLIREIFNESR